MRNFPFRVFSSTPPPVPNEAQLMLEESCHGITAGYERQKAPDRAGCYRTADAGQNKRKSFAVLPPFTMKRPARPRYLIQVIFYAVVPDSHYVIGRPAPANQLWILIGQGD